MEYYVNNENPSIVKGHVNNKNPKSQFNCDTFLQYLNDNNNINLIGKNNLVWTCMYHMSRERLMSNNVSVEEK